MLHTSALRLRLIAGSILLTLSLIGCADPVREDRTVEFSRDGSQVAFQHGDEGVYVASADGKGVEKIFQPDASVLATSRPLASPADGRLIFTTAQPLESEPPPPPRTNQPLVAEGRVDWKRPVRYTCWLRSEAKRDQPAAVNKVFEARCDHIGYVTAGLAVRWHPDGQHIVYCASLDGDSSRHAIFEFDIATAKSRRIFPHAANAVICDWTPAGSHLVCVVGDIPNRNAARATSPPPAGISGTWIGHPADNKSWWRVPGSERLAEGELPSVIEMLRASRPAWTRDDKQFALVVQKPPTTPPGKITHELQRVDFASRAITKLAESEGPITDLYWSPDGQRLGYLQHDTAGEAKLNILDPDGQTSPLPSKESPRKFAGFDTTGRNVAYIVPSRNDLHLESKHWALLLIPARLARDSVRIAPADASVEGTEIFSGLRVTFPLWSPTEEKLSLWLTFMPRYISLLTMAGQWTPGFRPWGLWPGDPAATIDTKTGTIAWMAVSPQEELQIGHYHLLKRNNEEAWKWYAKAREKLPVSKPPANWQEFLNRLGSPENSQPFEAICLQRLGRPAEAAARWADFEQNFYPAPPVVRNPGEPIPLDEHAADAVANDLLTQIFGPQTELMKPFLKDLFLAEVFLSVDGLDEALAHFRRPAPEAETDEFAFSRAVVLAQLLLIARDHEEYFKHCTDVVAPLALKLWIPDKAGQPNDTNNLALQMTAGLCLAPLFRSEFIEQLPKEMVEQQIVAWKQLAQEHDSGLPAAAIDLVLRAAAPKLDDKATEKQVAEHLAANPAAQQIFAGRPIDDAIAAWFEFVQPVPPRP